MTLGETIAKLRKQKDWTQDQFAEKVGVHGRHVSRWETDKMKPPVNRLNKIAQILEISVEELIKGNGTKFDDIQDEDLANNLRQVEELDEEDQAVVIKLVQALVTKKRMEKVLKLQK